MIVALIVLGALLGLAASGSAIGKLTHKPELVTQLTGLGVPERLVPVLGLLEIAGTAGLLIGVWVLPLGVAAAIGLTLYFAGAVIAHLRHHDRLKDFAPAVLLFAVAIATLVLEMKR